MKNISKMSSKQPCKWRQQFARERSRIMFMLMFGLPTIAAYLYFCFSPIFTSLYTSFYKWSGFSNMDYVGWGNYINVLKDPIFFKAIKNDIFYVLGKEILIVPITILLAIALTRLRLTKVEKTFYRYIFYLPNILSVIIIAIVWAFIYDPYNGLLNGVLEVLGLSKLIPQDGWLVQYTMPSIIIVSSWCGIGLFLIILISAINSVPAELYEAAELDGAGEWNQLWYVTFPNIWGQIKFMVIQIIIGTIGNYSLAMALANGGVNGSGMVMGLYVYQYGIDSNAPQVGYANAAAVILMIISSSVILLVDKLMDKGEQE